VSCVFSSALADRARRSSLGTRTQRCAPVLCGCSLLPFTAWPVRESTRFSPPSFLLDWEHQTIRCPAGQETPVVPGGVIHFPCQAGAQCPWKERCTPGAHGRCVRIHPHEALLVTFRERHHTAQGRATLRERVAVEQTLARVGWQGRHARYLGVRTHLCDMRRCAVVHHLHVIIRSHVLSAERQDAA
jgi:hypothetical protein